MPAVINWASGEVVFDSATPDKVINDDELEDFNARFMRLLDPYAVSYTKEDMPKDLTPARTDLVSVSGGRWYFKELTGSLSQLFYYDTLASKLVFRGSVNGKESGDPALSSTPLTTIQILPNILTDDDVKKLEALATGDQKWKNAIEKLFSLSKHEGESTDTSSTTAPRGLSPTTKEDEQYTYLGEEGTTETVVTKYRSYQSHGTGAMLVPNPESLTGRVLKSPLRHPIQRVAKLVDVGIT